MLSKTKLAGMMLGAVLLLGGAGTARADNCSNRIRRVQNDLNRAIQRNGYFSRQANDRRNEMRRVQNSCGWYNNGSNNRGWGRNDGWWRRGDGDNDRDDRGRRNRDRDHNWNKHHDRDGDHDGDKH